MKVSGSCLVTYEAANDGSVTDEHAYFETALKLKGQCDIMEVLSQAGISLGDSAPATTISRAIQQGCGGAKPELECCQHCQGNYLESVYTCYDKDFAAVDCKAVTSWGICKGDVTIPLPDRVLSLSTDNLTRTQ
eukprot:jgi/Astpho2/4969/Aster-x0221